MLLEYIIKTNFKKWISWILRHDVNDSLHDFSLVIYESWLVIHEWWSWVIIIIFETTEFDKNYESSPFS